MPKNECYTNRNGNDLLYMLKLNKHFILKKNPDSYLKPVCLIARYIYFALNELNQNTKNKEQYVSKKKRNIILNERKEHATTATLHSIPISINKPETYYNL